MSEKMHYFHMANLQYKMLGVNFFVFQIYL